MSIPNDTQIVSFIKSATEGMLLTNDDGSILLINQAAAKLLTTPLNSDLKQQDIFSLFKIDIPTNVTNSNDLIAILLKNGGIIDTEWKRSETEKLSLRITINPIQVTDQQHYIFILRKLAPQGSIELHQLAIEEQQKLRLQLKNEKEFNQLKSKFISIASHEFRTPLSTILASADLIGRYAQKLGTTHYDRHVNRIKSSVRHLTRILEDFLSLDKLEEGQIGNRPQTIDINRFVERILQDLAITLKEGQKVDARLPVTSTMIEIDPKVLSTVLTNLLSNAAKYTSINSVIDLHLQVIHEQLYLKIKDEGIGIPETDQPHIYNRFYRGQNTIRTNGAGLGLNVVQKYIELVNGKISFTSVPNQGTIFEVWLPVKEVV